MDHDSTDQPESRPAQGAARFRQPDLPPQDLTAADVDPATIRRRGGRRGAAAGSRRRTPAEAIAEGPLAVGHAAIENAVRLAPTSPGVYRMLNAASDVLYVGKAKNVRKRLSSYARVNAPQPARILRMIAATVTVEIISTTTETEALLLEANLIKQLRPRFNVQLRDDKSFPYILITGDHWAPQILKHRGAQIAARALFRAVRLRRRGQPHHHGAAARLPDPLLHRRLLRKPHPALPALSDPPLLRAPAPARSISPAIPSWCARRTTSCPAAAMPVKQELAGEMEKASAELEFETAALYRDRLAALSAIQSQQGINPRTVEEADVFAIHQEGGYSCVEVFFFRTGQNWGNRAYFPRAEKSFTPEEVLASFLAQFYDDKPPPKLILLSHEIEESELLADALSVKAGFKVEVSTPQARRKEGADRARADQCARGARPQARRYRDPEPPAAGHGRPRSACRMRRSASRSTTTATSRAPTRSAP